MLSKFLSVDVVEVTSMTQMQHKIFTDNLSAYVAWTMDKAELLCKMTLENHKYWFRSNYMHGRIAMQNSLVKTYILV